MKASFKLFSVFLLILFGFSLQALELGMSKEDVEIEIGSPNGIRKSAIGEKWIYAGGAMLEFENDKLVWAKGVKLDQLDQSIPEDPPEALPVEVSEKELPEVLPMEDVTAESRGEQAPAADEEAASEIYDPFLSDEMLSEDDYVEDWEPTSGFQIFLWDWAIPVIIQFAFLVIAFKWCGAEAFKVALFLIALVDFLVVTAVRWLFLEVLGFPMTFYADYLASLIVLLSMITTMTHAKQLPLAVKIVITSKVAAIVSLYLIFMGVLYFM